MRDASLPSVVMCCLAATLASCSEPPDPSPAEAPAAATEAVPAIPTDNVLAAFQPLPEEMTSAANPVTGEKITLGRMLYYDARLSKNHDVSCNSCHGLTKYGVDGLPTSTGHKGQKGGRNAPTVYNAGGHIAQFWDGRAADLEAQAKGPPLNPIEMAMASGEAVAAVLKSIPDYGPLFTAAFPGEEEPISYDNMAKAIGAFERKLVTPSAWDTFLKGEKTALSAAQTQGFNDFVATGCVTCHNGPYVGGSIYQKLGVISPWPNQKDQGRFEVTKNPADKMIFKVPSLRNIDKTGPYFHDGGVASLDEAIEMMARHQLGKELDASTVTSIKTFLGALTGPLPTDYIAQPELPASGPETPAPDPT